MRLPFDRYEQAKLTETYMKIRHLPPSEWKEDIAKLSDTLRNYAKLRGMEIDETYRNEAGIALQIRAFDYAATNGKRGLKPASAWMYDVLNLYQNQPAAFQELLQEANIRMGVNTVDIQTENGNSVGHAATEILEHQRVIAHQPYEDIPADEVWDKAMLAETVETYYRMKERPSGEWDECGKNLAASLSNYVRRYRPSLLDQMNYEEAAGKIAVIHMMFQEHGSARAEHSMMDLQMFWMRHQQPEQFQEYLNDFESCLSTETVEQNATNADEEDAALDRYETAKLVELCSRSYKHKELRELSNALKAYADKRGIEDTKGMRSIYQLNRRTSYIFCLLPPGNGEKQGTLPLEREIVHMYLERPEDFSALITEANLRMGIEALTPTDEEGHPVQLTYPVSADNRAEYEEEQTGELVAEKSATSMNEEQIRCRKLLEDFPNGIDVDSSLGTDQFCTRYEELYGSLPNSGEAGLLRTLEQVGEKRDGKIFPAASRKKKDLLQKIKDAAVGILGEGYSCVYIEKLYTKYRDELGKEAIYGVDDLKNFLQPSATDTYAIRSNRIVNPDRKADIGEDVLSFLKLQGEPVHITAIEHDLWHIPLRQIKQAINAHRGIINTEHQAFMAAETFPVSQEDLEQIAHLVDKALALSPNGQLKDEELRSLVEKELPSLATDAQGYTLKAFHGSLGYWLDWVQKKFHFEGHYVAKSQKDLQSAADNFRQFCADRERFTLEELSDFAKENNVHNNLWYYYDVVQEISLRITQEEFVRKDQVQFDVAAIDARLEQFCPGDYAPLKTVKNFMLLPMATGANWSYFLLESYVHSISKTFYLAHARFLDTDCIGAMVRRNVQFENYDALLTDVLAKNDVWENEKEALDVLASEGYLGRTRYSKISEICQKAGMVRQRPSPSRNANPRGTPMAEIVPEKKTVSLDERTLERPSAIKRTHWLENVLEKERKYNEKIYATEYAFLIEHVKQRGKIGGSRPWSIDYELWIRAN